MDSKELKKRLALAEEKVGKIKNTIKRHETQAKKKLQVIKDNNWDEKDKYAFRNTPQYNDSYWAVCEYQDKLDDIKTAEGKLRDAENVVKNWKDKVDKQIKLETVYEREMPEIFKQCQIELAKTWTETDIEKREYIKKCKQELSFQEFRKRFKYTQEELIYRTDTEIKKSNMKEAELFIIDLYNRVKAITGEVKSWSNIHYGGKALNGFVEGENGKVKVETIGAGGYNIQRYHLRVLVKEYH
jgi:hypothetical protein